MTAPAARPLWFRWAQLVRLPTVFTILAQVTAAFWLAAGAIPTTQLAWPRLLLVLAAAISVYWAGMILNDVNDLEEDRRDRPGRPLPSGQIATAHAVTAAWGLLILSVLLALGSGLVAAGPTATRTMLPAVIAVLLAACVVLYDGPLKPTELAPWTMGLCRGLVFLLGAAPLLGGDLFGAVHLWALAAAFMLYIAGITMISRWEAGLQTGRTRRDLTIGAILAVAGVVVLALAPGWAPPGAAWRFPPDGRFLLLVALVSVPLLIRLQRAIARPQSENIQHAVRLGILNLIPYSAVLVLLVAGQVWAIAVFLLGLVAKLAAAQMRVT